MILWLVCCFGFFLINFTIKYLNGNVFYNYFMNSVSQVLSNICAGILFKKTGIKPTLLTGCTCGILGSLMYILFGEYEDYVPYMVLFSKFGCSCCFSVMFIITTVLYPAALVSRVLWICNFFARTLAVFAPIVAEYESPLPMVVFCALFCMGGVSCLFLMTKPVDLG